MTLFNRVSLWTTEYSSCKTHSSVFSLQHLMACIYYHGTTKEKYYFVDTYVNRITSVHLKSDFSSLQLQKWDISQPCTHHADRIRYSTRDPPMLDSKHCWFINFWMSKTGIFLVYYWMVKVMIQHSQIWFKEGPWSKVW